MKIKLILFFIIITILFHLLLILNLIPNSMAWGGRMEHNVNFYVAEGVAIGINAILIWILLMKASITKQTISNTAIKIILWCYIVLFSLNTIGCILANTMLEKSFAIITILLVVLLYQVNISKKEKVSE